MTSVTTPRRATEVEAVGMTKRFGAFTALDNVTLRVRPGSFHALLGENGAGKSTLVKCIMGFHQPSEGGLLVDQQEVRISDPRDAQAHGLGMVYQHFTLAPSLSAAENLVIARGRGRSRINWRQERERLAAFMASTPFALPLDRQVGRLAAGEKQKLEILKQLYLGSTFLILDEPTSVLTPDEADEVLGHIRQLLDQGQLSVLMISHKFREVRAFADEVTVLRRGKLAGRGAVAELTNDQMAQMMMGEATVRKPLTRTGTPGAEVLHMSNARAADRSGVKDIAIDDLRVSAGEIVGVAGVSGNGQVELMEVLTGQRHLTSGRVRVKRADYGATRAEARRHKVRYLPEEPLQNACAPHLSVAENLALRDFDGNGRRFWLDRAAMTRQANTLIEAFDIRTQGPDAPIRDLSGGNVQRAALARELTGDVELLIVANPCFGLDFQAADTIRDRIMQARNAGSAVLLISEDLDEILSLSDRVVVISEGRITFETPAAGAQPAELGHYMAGHHA